MIPSIGTTLFELRKNQQLTQRQLCEMLNLNRSSYSYYETDSRIPDLDTAAILARFYGIKVDDLIHTDWVIDLDIEKNLIANKQSDEKMLQYLHHIGISNEHLLSLNKSDFIFLEKYKQLSDYDQSELQNTVQFKLHNKHS